MKGHKLFFAKITKLAMQKNDVYFVHITRQLASNDSSLLPRRSLFARDHAPSAIFSVLHERER